MRKLFENVRWKPREIVPLSGIKCAQPFTKQVLILSISTDIYTMCPKDCGPYNVSTCTHQFWHSSLNFFLNFYMWRTNETCKKMMVSMFFDYEGRDPWRTRWLHFNLHNLHQTFEPYVICQKNGFKGCSTYFYMFELTRMSWVVLLWNIIVLCYFEYLEILKATKGPARPSYYVPASSDFLYVWGKMCN